MKLNANRAKSAAIDSGAAIVGAVAAHALTNKATEMLLEKSPDSEIAKHIPAILVAVCIGVQAMGIAPANNDYLTSALLGATVTSGMSAVREYSGANDDAKNTSSGSVASLINQYVPAQGAAAGLMGLGNTVDYRETAEILRMVGQGPTATRQLQPGTTLQNVGAAGWNNGQLAGAAPQGVKSVGWGS